MERLFFAVIGLTALTFTNVVAQDPGHQMTARGAETMGFDQEKTTHHFYLYEDGGAIVVTVKEAKDHANLAAIRSHLPHIAQMFAAGDFSAPHYIHAQDVPGTEGMKRLKDRISYTYEEIRDGGRVLIKTRHARALLAVHDFLKYQITDHKTGDPLEITKGSGNRDQGSE
jgi:hypothetical protein